MRRLFTKAKNELLPLLTTNLPKPNMALKVKYKFFAVHAEIMFEVDEKIKEHWLNMENLDEELYFQELEAINEYESEWIKIKTRYEDVINKAEECKYNSAPVVSSRDMGWLRLPKLELPKFDVNVEKRQVEVEDHDEVSSLKKMEVSDDSGDSDRNIAEIQEQIPKDVSTIIIKDENTAKKEREQVAKDNFDNSVSMNNDGRFEVSLPWKDEKPEILSNKETVMIRLKATSKKPEKHNGLENYDACCCLGKVRKRRRTKWIVNPPAPPWWRGWWERKIQLPDCNLEVVANKDGFQSTR